jgi:hypothetical protein
MGKRLFREKVIMDAMQKGIIKAMVDAKRYIFYFDVIHELTREQFQEMFETNDFDLLESSHLETCCAVLNKLYDGMCEENAFDDVAIVVNDIKHLGSNLYDQPISVELQKQYESRYMGIFMNIIKAFALKGVPVYLVAKSGN